MWERKGRIRDRRIAREIGNFIVEDRDVEDEEGRSRKVRKGGECRKKRGTRESRNPHTGLL